MSANALREVAALAATPIIYFLAAGWLQSGAAAVLLSTLWVGTVVYLVVFRVVLVKALREEDVRPAHTKLRILIPADFLYLAILVWCLAWAVVERMQWLAVAVGGWLAVVGAACVAKYVWAVREPEPTRITAPETMGRLPPTLSGKITGATAVCCVGASCVLVSWLVGLISSRAAAAMVTGLLAVMAAGTTGLVVAYYRGRQVK
jgi:hypothetical protein